MKDSTKKFALGTLVAAAAGFVAGILTAPQSGKETRQEIKDTTVKGMKEAERQLKRLHTELNDVLAEASEKANRLTGQARDELDTAADKARKAKEAAREILSALHDGKAEDRELQKSIKEAQKAVDHLKGFLKKRVA
jgi:gas vesicle protein